MLHKSTNPYKPCIPFSGRLRDEKQEKKFRDLYDMLSKVNVNLPFLDVIKNMSSYVKFFKDLVTKKRQFEDGEKVVVYEVASAMQHDLPKKERDPGAARSRRFETNSYVPLAHRPHDPISQKGGRRCSFCVGKLIVPVDFVVLDVGDVKENMKDHTILLGRPFMATTNTLIDVKNGTLNMTVLGESVSIFFQEATFTSLVNFVEECTFVDVMDPFVGEMTRSKSRSSSLSSLIGKRKKSSLKCSRRKKSHRVELWRHQRHQSLHVHSPDHLRRMCQTISGQPAAEQPERDGSCEEEDGCRSACANPTGTFQRCMFSIFSDMLEDCLQKSHFTVKSGVVLGQVVSSRGIEIDKAKVDVIEKLLPPMNVKGVRIFLGHVGFYRRFTKDFSKIIQPLCNLLANDVSFVFDDACVDAFDRLKNNLMSAPIVIAPDWSLPFEIMC
ncbi:pol polyprotein [Striga asiatica]|uniref:Pol polyprotein n=1 Tax=Striga asiatica TaxID=4170 RepID=A0A5A7QHW8_STRAF|nr:pol polyprotein [Striga asiatica]